jgi:hypothetical protein
MRILSTAAIIAISGASICSAGELGINIIVSGQVAPGVYGQVQIGNNAPPPPVVYAQPIVVESPPNVAPPPPVYLHVPPEHARDWRHHCGEYHACGRPVYFVKSAEYEPNYQRRDHDRGRDHDWDDHGHDRHRDDHDRD